MGTGTAELPDGLATMPPGAELAAALSTVDRSGLRAGQLQVVLIAQARQVAHDQALLMADALALARIPWDGTGPGTEPDTEEQALELETTRVAWTLTMSERAAGRLLDLGTDLIERLPMVYAALLAGRIDYQRAWTISKALQLLPDDVARAIAESLLIEAERLTPAKLRARLALRAIKADPDLARKRYKRSVADRRVHIGTDSDHTARLTGQNLPTDRAAAAEDRIDRLARAAKADGDIRTLEQLRADMLLDVLAGRPLQVLRPSTDPLTDEADREAAEEAAAREAANRADTAFAARLAAARAKAAARAAARTNAAAGNTDADRAAKAAYEAETRQRLRRPRRPNNPHAADTNAADANANVAGTDDRPDPASAVDQIGPADQVWADRQPWAHDLADTPQWMLGNRGDDRTVHKGPEPPGPDRCTCGGVRPAERRGVVDIVVPLSTLIRATEHPGLIPGWGPVIADIARQVALDQEANPAWKWSVTDSAGQLLHHGHTGRRPTTGETAFIQARDRTCRAPGCTRRAVRCDIDHRKPHAQHGPSHRGNCVDLCRRHHVLKHEKKFVIHPVGQSGFMWEAPDGGLYLAPGDGDIIAVDEAGNLHDGTWDLDNVPVLPPVKHILPTG